MKKYLPLFLAAMAGGLLTLNGFGQPVDPKLHPGEGSCLGVIESFGLPLELETEHGALTPDEAE